MPGGRPSDYTEELALAICEKLPFADRGLAEICEADDMPSEGTVYRWLNQHVTFREAYTGARELAGEIQAARALKDALEATDAALGRLKFDARKWSASKLAPRKYGDKLDLTHTGQDGGPIQSQTEMTIRFVRPGDGDGA